MYAIINNQETLNRALTLARGTARKYGDRYKRSAQSILRRCQAAGLPIQEKRAAHGKRIVVID